MNEENIIQKMWNRPAVIAENNFLYKSLSNWSYNMAVGCNHACRFCYVPEVSTIRMGGRLEKEGVQDADAEWGNYVFVRPWDKNAFLHSLAIAQATPKAKLKPDGNRAVMLCTTTDPYQVLKTKELNQKRRDVVRNALEAILTLTDLNVRILTRSPLAKEDFDLFKKFGPRLMFGMSLPTLNNRLASIYEPKAPAPTQRLATLQAAKEAGLNVYVAVAPTYPECDYDDMTNTFRAVKELKPLTVFMEPINIRAENIERIEKEAASRGFALSKKSVFATPENWRAYAIDSLQTAARCATETKLLDCLHLWPDKCLGSRAALKQMTDGTPDSEADYMAGLNKYWNRISEWPV